MDILKTGQEEMNKTDSTCVRILDFLRLSILSLKHIGVKVNGGLTVMRKNRFFSLIKNENMEIRESIYPQLL